MLKNLKNRCQSGKIYQFTNGVLLTGIGIDKKDLWRVKGIKTNFSYINVTSLSADETYLTLCQLKSSK